MSGDKVLRPKARLPRGFRDRGALSGGGKASFKDVLSKDDVTAIRAYGLDQAHQAWDAKQKGK